AWWDDRHDVGEVLMSDFYGDMAGIASEILAEFKQGVITLTKTAPGEPDPATPWISGEPIEVTYPLDATAKPVSEEFINGTTIIATDIEIVSAVFGADPDPADQVEIDGRPATTIKVMRIPAAGTVVAWRFIVRG